MGITVYVVLSYKLRSTNRTSIVVSLQVAEPGGNVREIHGMNREPKESIYIKCTNCSFDFLFKIIIYL